MSTLRALSVTLVGLGVLAAAWVNAEAAADAKNGLARCISWRWKS